MQRLIIKLSLLSLSLPLITFSGTARAAMMSIDQITLGKIIDINGQTFTKISHDAGKGSQFIALQKSCAWFDPQTTMQGWTGCSALATPLAADFTQGPILTDLRDCKTYEIRKFADGKCWMADNLAYGGTVDKCAKRTGYVGDYNYSDLAWGYGNCRDPTAEGMCANGSDCSYCATGVGTGKCGYLYNWHAALQLPSAYYNNLVTYPRGTPSTTNYLQGICPAGWHLPSGGNTPTTSEFATLDIANGGTGVTQTSCATASCNFWRPGYAYNSVHSGRVSQIGIVDYQGTVFYSWSANEYSAGRAWSLAMTASGPQPGTNSNFQKGFGFSVRCIKN